ncbi:MAG: hypothetical protein ACT4QF_03320 [Sporichthyaceae bacterium]
MISPGRLAREATFWTPLLAAVLLIALWPPHTVDGPAHVLGASVLADWDEEAAFRRFYERDLSPTPNLGGNLLLAVLVKVLGMRAGETVVLLACAVGLPLALRLAVAAVRPENGWAAVAALPFGFGYLYFYGFYGFCLGLVLFLCAVAVALGVPSPRRTAGLTLLLTATWFTHLVPFAMAVATIGLLSLVRTRDPRALAAAAVPMLPGLALTASYALRTEQGDGPTWLAPPGLALGLLGLHSPLVALDRAENVVAGALAALFVAVVLWGRGAGAGTRGIAVAALAATALYLAAPNSFGIDFGLVNERLALFPVLLGLLWLLSRPLPVRAVAVLAAGAIAAAGALLAVRAEELRRVDRLAEEYASATPLVARGSTLVALRFAEFTPDAGRNRRADPIRHLSSLLAARTGSVDVGHYEAVLDYFPARFRLDADPRRALDPELDLLGRVPAPAELLHARDLAGGRIGYVLLVGATAVRTPEAGRVAAEFRDRLAASYERVGVTAPTGLVEVWRSRPLRR